MEDLLRQCIVCKKTWFTTPNHRRHLHKFCSVQCRSLHWKDPQHSPKWRCTWASRAQNRPGLSCAACGTIFCAVPRARDNAIRRRENRPFCSTLCQKSVASTESSERMRRTNLKRAEEISRNMRDRNPMRDPATRERMRQKLLGRTFLSRGGNGKLTRQQTLLAKMTGLPTEVAIATAPVKSLHASLPNCYKVDLASVEVKLAVEVDGQSHRLRRWKFLDARKTAVLNSLGWTVLRFTNQQVDQDPTGCRDAIWSTISKLKSSTTTSPTTS